MDVLVDLRGVVSVEAFADVTHGVPQDVSANDRLVFPLPSAMQVRTSTSIDLGLKRAIMAIFALIVLLFDYLNIHLKPISIDITYKVRLRIYLKHFTDDTLLFIV